MEQSLAPILKEPELEKLELSLEKALILKNQLLLSPGVWNGDEYTSDIIRTVFENTDWNELRHSHLYLDHKDTQDKSGVGAWAGFVRNLKVNSNGELRADLEIWHPMAATWAKAHPSFGISATIQPDLEGNPKNFESFSIVHDPACKPAIINLSENKLLIRITKLEKELNDLQNEFKKLNSLNSPSENENKLNMEKKMPEEEKKEAEVQKQEPEVKEEVKEEKSEESSKELSEKVNTLSEKLDKLVSVVEKKILSEEEEEEEEEEESEEPEEAPKEESNSEIENLKKELSSIKKELDNKPDFKTVASNVSGKELSNEEADIGMLRFLQKRVM